MLAGTAAPRYKGRAASFLMNSFLRNLKICPGWVEPFLVPAWLHFGRAFDPLRGDPRFEKFFEEPNK